jgi:hypothetical protein
MRGDLMYGQRAIRQCMAGAIVVLTLGLWATPGGCRGEDKPATPAGQFKALLKEYQEASGGGVSSDEERLKFIGQVYRLRNALAMKFIELAETYPNDPVAVDALMQAVWQVNGTPWPVELVGRDDVQARALALLQRDHIKSAKLGPACQRLAFGFRKEYEPFLRAVLEKSPHREVQAQAGPSHVDTFDPKPSLAAR